jgi:Fur family transcriptional regulator, ferric uptake regulator
VSRRRESPARAAPRRQRPLPNGRHTIQRRALRAAFERAARPLSPGEALAAARHQAPGLGIATVYRNIRALVAEGWLAAVPLPGAPNRYEVAGKHHHHHFRCRVCDRVYEVDACPPDLRALIPRGFRLEDHDITLVGRCAACARG